MSQHSITRVILCSLLVLASSAQAQQNTIDPMLGGYGVGKSEELVWVSAQFGTPTNVYIGLYDWNATTSALVPLDSMLLFTCTASDWGPKQADIAVGDFNCDTRDDIVAVAQTTNRDFALIVPRLVPGTLTWDTPNTINSAPGALYYDSTIRTDHYGNISGLRLLAADLDTIPGQEFLLAYLTPDTNLQLVMYKTDSLLNPIPVDSVRDPDKLFTTRASACNERSHVFDITAGDFDGDWVDEIMLIGEYKDANNKYVLYNSIYEYSGGTLHRVHRQDSILWQARYPLPDGAGVNFVDRIAVAAADFHGVGRDQALLFVHWIYQQDDDCNDQYDQRGGLFGLIPNSTMDNIAVAKDTCLLGWRSWWYSGSGSQTSEHGLSVADLNLDGRAEYVMRGGQYMQCGNWELDNTVTTFTPDVLIAADEGFDMVSESRRSVIFADLDCDTAQASWTPEVIAGWHDRSSAPGHIRTWSVDIDVNGSLTGITQRHDISFSDGSTSDDDTWYPFVFAAGDFDGDGVRLGRPNHVSFTHAAEPMVVLNAPPIHYDQILNDTIAGNDTVDVIGFWTHATIDDSVSYETSSDSSTSVGSRHSTDWNVSGSVGGKLKGLGLKINYKLTAAYGGNSERISDTTTTVLTNTGVQIAGGDRVRSETVGYDVWEYPIYAVGELQGYHVVVQPKQGLLSPSWEAPQYLAAESYRPRHEVGMLLSYPRDSAELMKRGDVDTILAVFDSWTIRAPGDAGAARIAENYGINKLMSNDSSRTRKVSIDLEAETKAWKKNWSATGHYGVENVETRKTTIGTGFQIRTTLTTIQNQFSPYAYNVSPVSFYSKSGALVVDYIVTPLTGGSSWWTRDYGSKPDPAFLLPWRYHEAKGIALGEPSMKYRTPDLYFEPYRPVRGEIVKLLGRVHNYSLDSLESDVELRFYSGNPECVEAEPLYSISGDSTVILTGGIGARTFQDFEFEWEVPLDAPDNARVWVLLDPEDAIAEIHGNNNMAWCGVFVDDPVYQTCTPSCPIVMTGDVNLSTSLTSADIIYLVNFVFKGGAVPAPCEAAGDVNGSGNVTSADIIYMVNHVFKGGPVPQDVCGLMPGMWTCP